MEVHKNKFFLVRRAMEEETRTKLIAQTDFKTAYDNPPTPVAFQTFERIAKLKKKGRDIHGLPALKPKLSQFADRFLDTEEVWKRKSVIRNSTSRSPEPIRDSSPSPAVYSLISYWKSSKGPAKKDAGLPNVIDRMWKGPTINAYYTEGSHRQAKLI